MKVKDFIDLLSKLSEEDQDKQLVYRYFNDVHGFEDEYLNKLLVSPNYVETVEEI